MSRPKIALVVGTRPDAIKTLPVVLALKAQPDLDTVLISTGQHQEMLEQVFTSFGVGPDVEMGMMKHGQTLAELTGRMTLALGDVIDSIKPQFLIGQGDTTTTFIAGLCAFYAQVPFGHIEAGLRTHKISDPFPEEFNRRALALVAAQHYAPTDLAAANLVAEGVDPSSVYVTGNTGIDAVMSRAAQEPQDWFPDHTGRVLLMTMHRRENWGQPMVRASVAIRALVETYTDTMLVVAMHRNPTVRDVLQSTLGDHPRIKLIEPPEYAKFAKLLQRADLIFTDSGGVQEEAPSFGKPILVLRETTERPEGVTAGCAQLVGTDSEQICLWGNKLLSDSSVYARMSSVTSPYGDGYASPRIVHHVKQALGLA